MNTPHQRANHHPLLTLLLLLATGPLFAQASFQAIDVGTNGSPRGYWAFLPADYHDPAHAGDDFPVVVFFHGLGEGGNGSTDLHLVLTHGPPKLVNADVQNNVFAANQVIMLAPQVTSNTWWNRNHIRPFLNHLLTAYRIDQRRIYFTGLSAGSSGIHDFMNKDPDAHQLAAVVTAAVRGQVRRDEGAYLAALIPYWGLTALGDASNTLINSANHMAGFLQDLPATDVMAGYNNDGSTHSAAHWPSTGWQWQSGSDAVYGVNPQISIYPGNSHFTWDMTYDNQQVWQWMFSQVKPELEIIRPENGTFVPTTDVDLQASASDVQHQVLSDVDWVSDVDGLLGTGLNLQTNLTPGAHIITATVADDGFRGVVKTISVTADDELADRIFTSGFDD